MTDRPKRSYIICTAPRSGSTLLCRMLSATGAAGQPDSHFHAPSFERWLTVYDLKSDAFSSQRDTLHAIFDAAIARGSGEGNIFGLRLQRDSFAYFMQQLGVITPGQMSDVERIESAFGPTTFIHLSRPDRLGQAISRLRAEQTGLWHRRADGSELERLAPAADAKYDSQAIADYMAHASQLDAAWERWFNSAGIAPFRIDYDNLAKDPHNTLADVLCHLGLNPAQAHLVAPPTARLADSDNLRWRNWFLAAQ
ncbi:Stf0 family sulfotransferase [Shimia sp.]|uniref:Stf0 family sulfotransferase n=1 Tax=Shimia sp. TaxID=1954381 RepID=UPI003296B8D3